MISDRNMKDLGRAVIGLLREAGEVYPDAIPDFEERMKNLDEIVESLPPDETPLVEIDISEVIGESPGTTVFTYRQPLAAELFNAQKDGKKIAARFPGMPLEMGTMVAMLAFAHVSPDTQTPKGLLYAKLATKNGNLFLFLMRRFAEAFPQLRDLVGAVEEEKKVSVVD